MKIATSASAFVATVPASVTKQTDALGKSDVFLDFQQQLARTAKVQRPVLLIGERGTGKELAAARVHFLSTRWGGPFVQLNCAALSPSVLESELFGHEVGAFTGAARRRIGRFEAANGGTLFLDEVGQMPMALQEKILRVIEYGSFERVGASEQVHVDVRIVGATNADLPAMAAEGKFKPDLLDRLSFEVLLVPSLRERGADDIDLLARHFASRMAVELHLAEAPVFSKEAQRALQSYSWPGNVRELKNVVERMVCRHEGTTIEQVIFDPFCSLRGQKRAPVQTATGSPANAGTAPPIRFPVDLPALVMDLERRMLEQALVQARYKQREAATLLGLSYDQFRGLYRKFQGENGNGSITVTDQTNGTAAK